MTSPSVSHIHPERYFLRRENEHHLARAALGTNSSECTSTAKRRPEVLWHRSGRGRTAVLGEHPERDLVAAEVSKEEIFELFIHLEAYAGAARACDPDLPDTNWAEATIVNPRRMSCSVTVTKQDAGERPGGDLGSDELEQSAVDLGSVRPRPTPADPVRAAAGRSTAGAPRRGCCLFEDGCISLPSGCRVGRAPWCHVSARPTDQVPIRYIMLGKSTIMATDARSACFPAGARSLAVSVA